MLDGIALHRGREYDRGTGCGKTARPGLHGGCRVTGIPTVEAAEVSNGETSITMTTQPQTDAHGAQISAEAERVLRDFVRAAVSRLSEALKDQALEWEVDSRWERGPDGHFREHTKHTRKLWSILDPRWLRSLPDYDTCVERLKSDLVVGPHLDRLVGTSTISLPP